MAAQAITSEYFLSVVSGSDVPVLIDFWAAWCGPCRALSPIVEEVADELKGKLAVYKCNVDEQPDLASDFHIVSIPTLIVFKDGKPVHSMVGSMPKAALLDELKAFI